MSINASVASQRITATVSGSSVTASVSGGTVSATASGGVGPPGAAASTLADLQDVQITNAASGDLLRRDGATWKNFPERSLVIDGGNW